MIGAATSHVRAGDTIKIFGPALALGVLSLGVLSLAEVVFRAASV